MESDYEKKQFLDNASSDIEALAKSFGSYVTGISTDSIGKYLVQFDGKHISVAMKMLQNVDFYDGPRTIQLAKRLKEIIKTRNKGTLENVFFCPMTTRGGDSADWMKRLLKNLDSANYKERREMNQGMLQSIYELEELADDDNPKLIVLLDHFIGTGNSIITTWGHMRQWQNNNHEYVVVTLVAYADAMEKIKEETDSVLDVMSGVVLPKEARAFHKCNHNLSDTEKDTIKKYCEMVESTEETPVRAQ